MMEDQFKSRLIDLDDRIKKDLKLLKQYEDVLRYEDDPRRSAKYQNDVDKLKALADRYGKEYEGSIPLFKILKDKNNLDRRTA